MGEFDQKVIKEFLIESYEGLDGVERDLVLLEENPTDPTLLAGIFRCIHTIKGTCGFLAFKTLESISHVGEDLLTQLRDGELEVNAEIISALLAMVDAFREIMWTIERTGEEGSESYQEVLAKLEQLQAGDGERPHPRERKTPEEEEEEIRAMLAEMPGKAETSPPQTSKSITPDEPRDPTAGDSDDEDIHAVTEGSIRVDVDLLDRLMNLVGELVLARNQILRRTAAEEDLTLLAPVQQLNLITTELQEGVMKTRLQPIGNIWGRFPRVVRDLAAECGKKVRIEMEGQETELDRTIIEAIKDPLTHIIRNAVDHGIETPEKRVKAGKPREGRLSIRAFHEGGQVNIEIADDGAGIDAEHVKNKAIQRGILTPDVADRMSAKEVINLIFRAGFSTSEQATAVSGRGVGMDVVRTNIEKIGGTVDLQSNLGHGTVLKLKIPLTLAIIPALIVRTGGDRYAIPQVSLVELVRLEGVDALSSIEMIHGAPVYRLRGDLLPLVYLNEALRVASNGASSDERDKVINIVVLQADDTNFGLVVDEVLDTEEIVVKPLNGQVKGIEAFAGATVAGDGKVALILDVLGLAQQCQVVSEVKEDVLTDVAEEESQQESNLRSLLVFRVGAAGRVAMPLSQVARLEEIPARTIEYAGRQRVVQYRGEIMQLIWLSNVLHHGNRAEDKVDNLQVVVYSHHGRSVGLVVDRIIDVIEEVINVEDKTATTGVTGALIVQGKVTDMLDAEAAIAVYDAATDTAGENGAAHPPDEPGSLYDRLGGEPAIDATVDQFYQRVLGDDELAPFFENATMDALKKHQVRFLTQALGGPTNYSGRPLKIAHANLSIEQHHFDRVAGHLSATLAALGVGPDLIDEVIAGVAPLAEDIVAAVPAATT